MNAFSSRHHTNFSERHNFARQFAADTRFSEQQPYQEETSCKESQREIVTREMIGSEMIGNEISGGEIARNNIVRKEAGEEIREEVVCFSRPAPRGSALHSPGSQSSSLQSLGSQSSGSQAATVPPLAPAVFDEHFARYRSLLEKRARQRVGYEDAEDMVSACYLEARCGLASYHPSRNLAWWLLGILDNLLKQHSRRRRVRNEELYAANACPEDERDEQTARGARQEAQHFRIAAHFASVDLTARQYECVTRTLRGEPQEGIARAMHISQRMVSYHLQAAVTRLRQECRTADSPNADSLNVNNPDEGGLNDGPAENDGSRSLQTNGSSAAYADRHALDFFCECAQHVIYRKPHSFDNQSTSEERERRRYAGLRDAKRGAGK